MAAIMRFYSEKIKQTQYCSSWREAILNALKYKVTVEVYKKQHYWILQEQNKDQEQFEQQQQEIEELKKQAKQAVFASEGYQDLEKKYNKLLKERNDFAQNNKKLGSKLGGQISRVKSMLRLLDDMNETNWFDKRDKLVDKTQKLLEALRVKKS